MTDKELINNIKNKFLKECKQNLRTKKLDDSKMIKRLVKIVQEEVDVN